MVSDSWKIPFDDEGIYLITIIVNKLEMPGHDNKFRFYFHSWWESP